MGFQSIFNQMLGSAIGGVMGVSDTIQAQKEARIKFSEHEAKKSGAKKSGAKAKKSAEDSYINITTQRRDQKFGLEERKQMLGQIRDEGVISNKRYKEITRALGGEK